MFATNFPDVHVKVLEYVFCSSFVVMPWRGFTVRLKASDVVGIGAPFRLDLRDDGPDIQGYLSQLTNQRTVPSIFISELLSRVISEFLFL